MGRQVSTAIDSDANLFELSIRGTAQREWKITACATVVMQKNLQYYFYRLTTAHIVNCKQDMRVNP